MRQPALSTLRGAGHGEECVAEGTIPRPPSRAAIVRVHCGYWPTATGVNQDGADLALLAVA